MTRLVLAISAEHADEILAGTRKTEHRTHPPKQLPARAYLAVPKVGVVGECDLEPPERKAEDGWVLPVTSAKRYARPRALDRFGLARTPRSFRYLLS